MTEISEMLRDEIIDFLENNDLKATSEEFGISEADLIDDYEINDMIEYYKEQRGGTPTEGVDSSMVDMNDPDFQLAGINPEYEGDGITSEVLPGDSMVADTVAWLADKAGVPPEAAMLMAGIAGKNPKNIKKGAEGMFTPKMTKKNLPDKRGTKSGEVVGDTKIGGPGVPVGKSTKGGLPVKRKEQGLDIKKEQGLATRGVDAKIGLTKRNAEKAAAGTLTGGLIANRMLSGNRNENGDFIAVDLKQPDPIELDESDLPGPEVETMGNQFGYHKKEGQNFWTVNNDDPYWDTHEMGTGDAWSDAELKKAPAKELDWSSWFN